MKSNKLNVRRNFFGKYKNKSEKDNRSKYNNNNNM